MSIATADGEHNFNILPPFSNFDLVLVAVLQNTIGVAFSLRIPHVNLNEASNFEQFEKYSQNNARKHRNCLCAGSF